MHCNRVHVYFISIASRQGDSFSVLDVKVLVNRLIQLHEYEKPSVAEKFMVHTTRRYEITCILNSCIMENVINIATQNSYINIKCNQW